MVRWLYAASLLAAVATCHVPARADTAAAFNDSTCPQANGAGRQLNELNAKGDVNGDDLMAAAQALVDGYGDCVRTFDQSQNARVGGSGDHLSDFVTVNRMYSRLQLARSYQRVGSFYEQLHNPDHARLEYDLAMTPLDQVATILSSSTTGIVDRGSTEFKLSAEASTLREQIVASEKKLTAAPVASPAAKY